MFVLIFQPTCKSYLKVIQITKKYFFWVNAPLWYIECAPNCKTQPQLKEVTITNIWHSTSILTFDTLSKLKRFMSADCQSQSAAPSIKLFSPNDMNRTLNKSQKHCQIHTFFENLFFTFYTIKLIRLAGTFAISITIGSNWPFDITWTGWKMNFINFKY